jgi:hypothetical protein
MVWKVAAAKEQFSAVLRRAAEQPQLIHNRERLVGAVLGPEDTEAFLAWRTRQKGTMGATLAVARRICDEEGADLELSPRVDWPNPVLEEPRARRHQRRL